MKKLKKIGKWLLVSIAIVLLVIIFSNLRVYTSTKNRLYTNVDDIPNNTVGLVLGTSRYLVDGRTNLFFKYRIDACVALYEAGKIEYIIVSGDNGHKSYNEPQEMMNALIERGIPAEKIFRDYAGFRTLDSVVRSKEIFGQQKLTIISQGFHNARALYIADKYDIEAVGFNAEDVSGSFGLKVHTREAFARVKMILDLHILNKQPKFLGAPVTIK